MLTCFFYFRMFDCLFGVYRPTPEYFTHIDTSPIIGEGDFDLCLALMAIGQWRFFSVPHLLYMWDGSSVYNGHLHLRGPVTLTPIDKRLAEELSLPVFTTKVCRDWGSNTQLSACGANAMTHCAIATVSSEWNTGASDIYSLLN